jgi:hypothetical protein
MILDLEIAAYAIPLLLIIGLILLFYGRETLIYLSFPIGALAGGYLAYMIFRGLLLPYDIPLIVEIIVSALIIIGGAFLGKGVMALTVGMFSAVVIVDLASPLIEPLIDPITGETEIALFLISLVLFMMIVFFVQRYLFVFSAFMGASIIALSALPLLNSLDEPVIRIIQLVIILILTPSGAVAQHFLYKRLEGMREEIVWIPSEPESV